MSEKRRLSVSVDADVVEAVRAVVSAGHAGSVSSWVNAAQHDQLERADKLRKMGEWVAASEAENGEISEEEMEQADRDMRARAIVVRDGKIYYPA